jgi:hypothetical protein
MVDPNPSIVFILGYFMMGADPRENPGSAFGHGNLPACVLALIER